MQIIVSPTVAAMLMEQDRPRTIHERIDPILRQSLAQQAYENTPEFRHYLALHRLWVALREAYKAAPTDNHAHAERMAWEQRAAALTACQYLPEHEAAFGWRLDRSRV